MWQHQMHEHLTNATKYENIHLSPPHCRFANFSFDTCRKSRQNFNCQSWNIKHPNDNEDELIQSSNSESPPPPDLPNLFASAHPRVTSSLDRSHPSIAAITASRPYLQHHTCGEMDICRPQSTRVETRASTVRHAPNAIHRLQISRFFPLHEDLIIRST